MFEYKHAITGIHTTPKEIGVITDNYKKDGWELIKTELISCNCQKLFFKRPTAYKVK